MNRKVLFGVAASGATAATVLGLREQRRRAIANLRPPGVMREIDGEQIHYLDEGTGPPIVLIHGFAGSAWSWRSTIPALVSAHRTVALDLPGFGYSDRHPAHPLSHEQHAHRVVRLMDSLGIESATVIGHSMGGAIAARVAVSWPARVDRLVLVASVDAGEAADWRDAMDRFSFILRLADVGLAIPPLTRAISRAGVRSIVANRAYITEDVVRGYCDPFVMPGTGACLRKLVADTVNEPPIDLSRISAPTLVISGDVDPSIPPATGERIAAKIPGARHVVVAGAGHLVPEEQPDAFLAELRGFLAQTSGAAAAPVSRDGSAQ